MADARFFARSNPHALTTIARWREVAAPTVARGTAPAIERQFSGVHPLQTAGPAEVSFSMTAAIRRYWNLPRREQ